MGGGQGQSPGPATESQQLLASPRPRAPWSNGAGTDVGIVFLPAPSNLTQSLAWDAPGQAPPLEAGHLPPRAGLTVCPRGEQAARL